LVGGMGRGEEEREVRGGAPPGIRLLRALRGRWGPGAGGQREFRRRRKAYKCVVLALTFAAYACYHASRKPTSIVKSVLDPEPPRRGARPLPWPVGDVFVVRGPEEEAFLSAAAEAGGAYRRRKKGWAPFDGEDGTVKLGEVDLAFLVFYSMGMYVAGHLGDSLDLRHFLAVGMVGSGCFVGLFGMGYFWGIHVFGYYIAMQVLAGLFQATGWPSVVAVVGNWFGKRRRGLIMGIWNAHTSVGNIGGSLLAASVLDYGWGWSFILPGGLITLGGVMVYFFLAAYPEDVGMPGGESSHGQVDEGGKDEEEAGAAEESGAVASSEQQTGSTNRGTAVGIVEACRIPGVIPFALCLFFSKLVAYTFLYWLPFYLSQTEIGGEYLSVKSAGNLSTLFDVGGIVGGVLAGYISDKLRARALTAASFMYLAIPSVYAYHRYGSASKTMNVVFMMIAGLFVNGPYALITTAVSADLGTHGSLKGDSRALATVTAIIDGTGSAGAALGPLLTGVISRSGWHSVFVMLMIGAFVAGALLSFLVKAEIVQIIRQHRKPLSESARQTGSEGTAAEPLLRG
ncbi:hypothetical protein Taro_007626, partial [Colocasia esculenta]|nr:hypothetical protein [Colocasia esculenta]